MNPEAQDATIDDQNEIIKTKDEKNEATSDKKKNRIESKKEKVTEVRKSERIRKQRMTIHPDQLGDCDDTQDLDYR